MTEDRVRQFGDEPARLGFRALRNDLADVGLEGDRTPVPPRRSRGPALRGSSYTFAWASLTQTLPDWIEAQVRALKLFGGVPKAHQRHGGMTPEYLILRAGRVGQHVAILVERLMRDRPHPEQGYRSALGVLSLERRFGRDRLEAACDRALTDNTVNYV